MFKFLRPVFNYYEVNEHEKDIYNEIRRDILRTGFIKVDWKSLEQKYRVKYYTHFSQDKIQNVFDRAFKSAFIEDLM